MATLRPCSAAVLIALALGAAGVRAQEHPYDHLVNDGYTLGLAVRVLDGGDQVHLVLPFSEARGPLKGAVTYVYGGHLLWGVSGLFLEPNVTAGVGVEPVAGVGLRAAVHAGTFLLDNVSVTGSLGAVVTIPLGRGRALSLEAEALVRHAADLLDYVSLQDPEALTQGGAGFGVGVGLRI